jgi:hypothetical protein
MVYGPTFLKDYVRSGLKGLLHPSLPPSVPPLIHPFYPHPSRLFPVGRPQSFARPFTCAFFYPCASVWMINGSERILYADPIPVLEGVN